MDKVLVSKAVPALQKYHSTVKEGSKPKLIEDDPLVSLVIALKKIPDRTIRPLRIPLPHSLFPPEDTELCLITKREKAGAKELLKEKKVRGVSKVIPISKLKTNYKSFEAKRQLSASYDIFLADKRLYQMLPRLLGKKFFEKKKLPIPVDMQKKDLASELQRARDSTYLHIGLGSCCCLPVGRVGFPSDHLVENILSAITGVSSKIPQGLRNIQSVHIKTPDSIALPVYNSLPPPPSLLPSLDDRPPAKRIKIEDSFGSEGADKVEPNPESDVDEDNMDPERKHKISTTPQTVGKSLVADLGPMDLMGNATESGSDEEVDIQKTRKGVPCSSKKSPKKTVRSITKLSAKKVRGSTVRSSKYEKALRRRTVN